MNFSQFVDRFLKLEKGDTSEKGKESIQNETNKLWAIRESILLEQFEKICLANEQWEIVM